MVDLKKIDLVRLMQIGSAPLFNLQAGYVQDPNKAAKEKAAEGTTKNRFGVYVPPPEITSQGLSGICDKREDWERAQEIKSGSEIQNMQQTAAAAKVAADLTIAGAKLAIKATPHYWFHRLVKRVTGK